MQLVARCITKSEEYDTKSMIDTDRKIRYSILSGDLFVIPRAIREITLKWNLKDEGVSLANGRKLRKTKRNSIEIS